jgi:uncharacterized protein with GYD domain
MIMATEYATEKLKFSAGFFLQYMVQQYIMLLRWTEQGIRNFKDTTRRADAAKREAERIGGKLTLYWTFGEYDLVCILEAPNDEAAMEFGLKVGSFGNVRTTTLKAFTEEEIAGVVKKLS